MFMFCYFYDDDSDDDDLPNVLTLKKSCVSGRGGVLMGEMLWKQSA